MHYIAHVWREGKHWLAEFPDCPGCQTFASSQADLRAAAVEALEGWLEAHLIDDQNPPQPTTCRVPRDRAAWRVAINASLSVALQVRWARARRRLTQGQLARRLGLSERQVAKLEQPGANPTIATLRKLEDALGVHLDITLAG